jgi:hypothetical protein
MCALAAIAQSYAELFKTGTHSLNGDGDTAGLGPRTITALFHATDQQQACHVTAVNVFFCCHSDARPHLFSNPTTISLACLSVFPTATLVHSFCTH